MNVANIDFDRFRLRSLMNSLAQKGEVEIDNEPTDLADVAIKLFGKTKAVWFRKVGPEGAELVGNVVASRERIAHAFGVAPKDLMNEIIRRLKTPQEIVEVPRLQAPVQQVVLTGADADLTVLPVHLQHTFDGAPYISAGVDYAVDKRTGWTNVGFRRMMLRGRQTAGVDLIAPHELRAIYEAARSRGEDLPISFVIGSHPTDMLAGTIAMPGDDLRIVSSLRGQPLSVVKCVSNDIRVPADAEWVIEGYLDSRGHIETEGPYGEFVGYYGSMRPNPLFHVTAITRRSDALFQTVTISGRQMARTDTAMLETVRNEVVVWQALSGVVREPVAVCVPISTGGLLNARVAIRQRSPGEARLAIHAVLGGTQTKHLFVVDPDIDVFSDDQMEWALATRFQGDRDIIVLQGVRSMPIDPSLNGLFTGAKVGFDLTWPFGGGKRLEESVPEPPVFTNAAFPNLRAALTDGPKSFGELMSAVGSRDGREIVRELEALGANPGLLRDASGRYHFAKAAG
jgi:UbiD family decarboxylase